jgi:hypothetical protein
VAHVRRASQGERMCAQCTACFVVEPLHVVAHMASSQCRQEKKSVTGRPAGEEYLSCMAHNMLRQPVVELGRISCLAFLFCEISCLACSV